MQDGLLAAEWPAPDHRRRPGQEVLPDPVQRRHGDPGPTCSTRTSVHFHGFPQSSTIFDGLARVGHRHQSGFVPDLLLRAWSSPAPSSTTATSRPPSTCRWECSATSTCAPLRAGWGIPGSRPATKPSATRPATNTPSYPAATPTTTRTARRLRPGVSAPAGAGTRNFPRRELERPAAALRPWMWDRYPDDQRPRLPRHHRSNPLPPRSRTAASRRSRSAP